MRDFPDWMSEALSARFDQQAIQASKYPPIKKLREQMKETTERFRQNIGDAGETDFLRWEEECNYWHAEEMEWLYMQGVKDGAQMLLSLISK